MPLDVAGVDLDDREVGAGVAADDAAASIVRPFVAELHAGRSSASPTTWALVTSVPSSSMRKPVPLPPPRLDRRDGRAGGGVDLADLRLRVGAGRGGDRRRRGAPAGVAVVVAVERAGGAEHADRDEHAGDEAGRAARAGRRGATGAARARGRVASAGGGVGTARRAGGVSGSRGGAPGSSTPLQR